MVSVVLQQESQSHCPISNCHVVYQRPPVVVLLVDELFVAFYQHVEHQSRIVLSVRQENVLQGVSFLLVLGDFSSVV